MVLITYEVVIASSNSVTAHGASHSKDDVNILRFPIEAENRGVSSKLSTNICVPFSHANSKPDTVEKLLQRIHESPVGEQVIAAILASSRNLQPSASISDTRNERGSADQTPEARDVSVAYTVTKPDGQRVEYNRPNGDSGSSLVSPLHILADAVETERLASLHILDPAPASRSSEEPLLNHTSNTWLSRNSTERLIKYFSMLANFPPVNRILNARVQQSLPHYHRKTGRSWLRSLLTLQGGLVL